MSEKWSLFAELQLRSLKFHDHFHYYEYTGGATFNISKNFSLQAGAGNILNPIVYLREAVMN